MTANTLLLATGNSANSFLATAAPVTIYYSALACDPDLAEIVELFVDEMPTRMRDMQNQFINNDWEQLGRLAHQIKGAAGSYGFDQLTPFAAHLEKTVRSGFPMHDIKAALDDLLIACGAVRSGMESA